jgi:YbgC/YbaW family acyl-CoA thioester hydrolase
MNKIPASTHKIRFSDCDMFGHLNNSRYLDYLIDAREDHLMNEYDFDFNKYYKNDLAWVITGHEIAYIRPAVYNEMVTIQSTLLSIEEEFLLLETMMMNEEKTHLKAIMRSKLVPINIKTGKKERHQTDFMEWAKQLENDELKKEDTLQDRIKQLLSEFKAIKGA